MLVTKLTDNKVCCITTCPMCRIENRVELTEKQFQDWQAGGLIQRVAPNLTADQRELLISGICPKCWDRVWNGE